MMSPLVKAQAGQRVLVVGDAASSNDIAAQLASSSLAASQDEVSGNRRQRGFVLQGLE